MCEEDVHKHYFKVKRQKLTCPMCYKEVAKRIDINHKLFTYLCLDCAVKEGYEEIEN